MSYWRCRNLHISLPVSRLRFAPRDETDADIERIANPQTAVESSERLDPELRLVDAETRDHHKHVVLPQHGRGEAQIARHSTEREACGDHRTPLRTDERDRLDPDERMLRLVEHVRAEHVLASVAARWLRDLCRKFVAFLGARCGRIDREGIDRNFEPEAARRRGVTSPELAVHAADDDVVVAEARERAVAVDEEADFGRLRIDAVARR